MTILKRIGIVVSVLLILFVAFAFWYRATYSMETVTGFEVNANSQQRVLIATQGSKFKEAVVNRLVEQLKARPVNIKVIDVSDLSTIHESDWNAIVIIHTWEYSKPPKAVQEFADRIRSKGNVVVLTTSGDGDYKLEGFDAISSASKLSEVNDTADQLVNKIDKILAE